MFQNNCKALLNVTVYMKKVFKKCGIIMIIILIIIMIIIIIK